ncbi:MAG: iron-sulfur cluster-binding domain-containing protein, partial [Pseudomonadota bacterium]
VGVTPMLAMAHRLHALGRDFALHYSAPSREAAAFLAEIEAAPWADRAHLHLSAEGRRADLAAILADPPAGARLYLCGPDRYMTAVQEAAAAAGWPEDAVRQEYFAVPEEPERENRPFTLRLARSGRDIAVAADQAATDALAEAGVHVDVKCSDGLCGVCRCGLVSGEVDHRDYVLTRAEREGA